MLGAGKNFLSRAIMHLVRLYILGLLRGREARWQEMLGTWKMSEAQNIKMPEAKSIFHVMNFQWASFRRKKTSLQMCLVKNYVDAYLL